MISNAARARLAPALLIAICVTSVTCVTACGAVLGYEDSYDASAGGSPGTIGGAGNAGKGSTGAGAAGGEAGLAGSAGLAAAGSAGAPDGSAGSDRGGAAGAAAGQAGTGGTSGMSGTSGAGGTSAGSAGASGDAGAGGKSTAPPSVKVVSLGSVVACAGGELAVTYETAGGFGNGFQIAIELSDPSGDAPWTTLGVVTGQPSATAKVPLPASLAAGAGYRVRLTTTDPVLSSSPFSLPLKVNVGTKGEIQASSSYVVEGTSVSFSVIGGPFTAYAWDFGPASVPATSTVAKPSAKLVTPGPADVRVVLTDANGCKSEAKLLDEESASICIYTGGCVSVLSCSPSMKPSMDFGSALRICDGKTVTDGGGGVTAFVEAGGTLNFSGGGSWLSYVKSGGTYAGTSGGSSVVVSEPGANISGEASMFLTCPKLTFTDPVACK